MITRTFSMYNHLGDAVSDLRQDAEIFKFTIDKIEELGLDDQFDYRFTITGEEGMVEAFFVFYDIQYDGEYDS